MSKVPDNPSGKQEEKEDFWLATYSGVNVKNIVYQCKAKCGDQYQEDSTCVLCSPDLTFISQESLMVMVAAMAELRQ